ncbi:hypothetical protein DICSQDRAFT_151167 [Dichomitus squalens LYAD-421 SS1]|uniref:Uncharacterized protein n=1 Tax=Dichomitus squalens TaxID=114155 RepID=A0A4Q9N3V5_9APHY|nr:uncharacterized protein DICSQDRAFT_151167 [Dichomitus squalens LYAD-421 SS1]EJF66725.1 hypothetical protein DICSQDRAFT_151167 [Dichomitus squalens LYAD-421 SS1]TBU35280.1 hypothetical protein BD311DRAFT_649445 [Dichomitus squalens]
MAGQSTSKEARTTGTLVAVSASQGSTADATTKASATASPNTSSSQAAHTTLSSSAVNSATGRLSQSPTEKAATTTAGGDATLTSGSRSVTQIAISSHTTNSEADAPTISVHDAPQQQALNQNPAETTSTITDKPEATLSTPVFVTVTNDQTSLSEPPVFTSVGVPPSDGQVVSATRVIASKTSTMVDLQDTVKWA